MQNSRNVNEAKDRMVNDGSLIKTIIKFQAYVGVEYETPDGKVSIDGNGQCADYDDAAMDYEPLPATFLVLSDPVYDLSVDHIGTQAEQADVCVVYEQCAERGHERTVSVCAW